MDGKQTLFLASTSPRRQELIKRLGLPVEVVTNNAEEVIESSWTPQEAVEQLSRTKAEAAYKSFQIDPKHKEHNGILIGADTIVVLDQTILGKPRDKDHAKEMLTALQGRSHTVLTGVTLIHTATGESMTTHQETKVWMKSLEPAEIDRYIETGEPMDKAGAYGIQGIGATLIPKIDGDYFNVVGLPLQLLAESLKMYGILIP